MRVERGCHANPEGDRVEVFSDVPARPHPWEGYARVARASIGAQLDRAAAGRTPQGRALDIGCGRGVHSARLAERGWDVVGIDQQEQAIAAARERGIRGVRFEVVDATRLESATLGTFDFFLDIGCFQGLDAPARTAYCRGVTALANPGARLLLLAFGPTRMRWLTEGVTPAAVTDGFPQWRLVHSEPAETKGLGWPMSRSRPMWFRFELATRRTPARHSDQEAREKYA